MPRALFITLPFITTLAIFIAGCTLPPGPSSSIDYSTIELTYDRSTFGNAPFPVWFNLTPVEIGTLQNIDKARVGDPEALLSLALLASGNVRDSAGVVECHLRMNKFIERIRPEIEAENDFWQKGFKLYQHMRKEFLREDTAEELSGYDWYQSRVSTIFKDGTYNCISSAILYCIVARWIDLRVEGALTPTHAFVQITSPTGKIIEVETTSRTGFDWVHDEVFYATKGIAWFQSRNMRSPTYEEYRDRRIVEPFQLICHNMGNQHTDLRKMKLEDVHRLTECRAFGENDNPEYQRNLLNIYNAELSALNKKHDVPTTIRFCRTVAPVVASSTRQFPGDTLIANLGGQFHQNLTNYCHRLLVESNDRKAYASGDTIYSAFLPILQSILREVPGDTALPRLFNNFQVAWQQILCNAGDFSKFITFTGPFLETVRTDTSDSSRNFSNALKVTSLCIKICTDKLEFADAEKLVDLITPYSTAQPWLEQNLQWALSVAMNHHWKGKNWPEVTRLCKKQMALDISKKNLKINMDNLQGNYCNWASSYISEGNWPKAREILRQCVSENGGLESDCSKLLTNLEKSHKF